MTQPSRTGGQILVDALKIHGVDTAFGVPGESYLDVLDALHFAYVQPGWPPPGTFLIREGGV